VNTASLFDSALAGLQAAQAGMTATSQNVAGSSVDGYVRRSPQISDLAMSSSTADPAGSTFAVEGFTRNFNALLQGQIYDQTGTSSYSSTLINSVSTLDSSLVDPTTSLAGPLGDFFNAVGSLANDPSNTSYQTSMLGAAQVLVDRIHGTANTLTGISNTAKQGLADTLNQANTLANELASVNAKIGGAGVPGVGYATADLLDERDRVLTNLSQLLGGQAIIASDGTASYEISGVFLVNREVANQFTNASGSSPISADQDFSGIQVKAAGRLIPIQTVAAHDNVHAENIFTSGQAGAYSQLLNSFVPSTQNLLAVISAMLVHNVNSYCGNTTANDPSTNQVSQDVFGFSTSGGQTVTNPSAFTSLLESTTTNSNGVSTPTNPATWLSLDQVMQKLNSGDSNAWQELNQVDPSSLTMIGQNNSNTFANLAATDLSAPIGRTTDANLTGPRSNFLANERVPLGNAVSYFTSSTATTMANWKSSDSANQTLMTSLSNQKESVSGVNLDEEAANLVKYQQLYNASSKVIQTSAQMFDTLLSMMN
jgi:flagellar hook-associated protein 1 FlgK